MIRRGVSSVYRFLSKPLKIKSGINLEKDKLNSYKMSAITKDVPIGICFFQKVVDKCCPLFSFNRQLWYRTSVLVLTYIAYMCYHMSRRPISVVKAVLHQNCSRLTPPAGVDVSTWCDWAPFDGTDKEASQLLGEIDSAFLFAYAFAMFFSGFIAERVNLRYFLSFGMLFSGVFSYLFGIAKSYNIHSFTYFLAVQVGAGIFQTTGWPGVVSVVSNWCGKSKRGLTFGIWNSHTSIGNIIGSLIAAAFVEKDWSLSFIYPGLLIGLGGFLMFLFLVVNPEDVGCAKEKHQNSNSRQGRHLYNQVANRDSIQSGNSSETDDTDMFVGDEEVIVNSSSVYSTNFEIQRRYTEKSHLLKNTAPQQEEKAIGFIGACKIPGVIEFSLSLFFSKLVSYTFLYWLPFYVQNSTSLGATYSAEMSIAFDVGGIIGAIAAGAISDYSNMSATTCVGMLLLAIPMMLVYQIFGAVSLGFNIFLLTVVGILVNGPYALITTAVSADLGTHSSLEGNAKALATVTAIIDGTGSIGAAVGPLLAGFVKNYGWTKVFYMLMFSDILALILLLRLVKQEITKLRRRPIRIE